MNPFPQLFTPRLHLRLLQVEDFPSLIRHANNPKIAEQILNLPHPFRELDAAMRLPHIVQGFKTGVRTVFAIARKENGEVIGEIAVHRLDKSQPHGQLAYWLGESYWGQGLATEAVEAVLHDAFDRMDLTLMYADFFPANIASRRVLEKNGFMPYRTTGRIHVHVRERG